MSSPYIPNFGSGSFITTIPPEVNPVTNIAGHGSPEGAVDAPPGTGYVDIDTDNLWLKVAGVQKLGWKLAGEYPGTAISSTAVFTGSGSPVGVITPATEAAFYIQQDSVPAGLLWSWYDGSWH